MGKDGAATFIVSRTKCRSFDYVVETTPPLRIAIVEEYATFAKCNRGGRGASNVLAFKVAVVCVKRARKPPKIQAKPLVPQGRLH